MKTSMTVSIVALAASCSAAQAELVGFAGFTRVVDSYRVIDVFALVSNTSDRLMNVYDANITNTNGSSFVQGATAGTRGWGAGAYSQVRTDAVDSFVTIGGGRVVAGGDFYASAASPDGNFTNWGGSAAPNTATAMPAYAGWFYTPPTDAVNLAENLGTAEILALGTRYDIGGGSAQFATFGVWCAHLVLTNPSNVLCNWSAFATVKDGVTGNTAYGSASGLIPAPSAVAMLAVAGLASRRRRA